MEELQKLGITPEDVIQHIKLLVEGNYVCTGTDPKNANRHHQHRVNSNIEREDEMTRYFIRNRTVTCNDGSQPGYYIRKRQNGASLRWIIFLEGGWLCFDVKSCQGRWINTPHLMSSNHWPQTRRGSGILSFDPKENPFIHDGNVVYVPYCSSDSWSGTHKARYKGEFSFMGALILQEVVKDLTHIHGLATAAKVYLAGTSAGATGVLLNLDRIVDLVGELAPSVEVRGISDSGWFLDNKQYKAVECTDAHQCAPTESVRRGIVLWNGLVPDSCKSLYSLGEHWKCYFGYRLYSTLRSIVFVIQNLFDEAQITVDNVGPPIHRHQWKYIHDLGLDMKYTLTNVSAVFAPACLSHMLITRSEWRRVTIDGISLPDALKCWENGKNEKNRYEILTHADREQSYMVAKEPRFITGVSWRRRDKFQADDPKSTKTSKVQTKDDRRKIRRRQRKQQQERNSRRHQNQNGDNRGNSKVLAAEKRMILRGNIANNITTTIDYNRPQHHHHHSRRRRRSAIKFDLHDIHHVQHHENQCNHHRLDHCAWPQCNPSCPKVRNPFTGDEMDFVELLVHFGLDLSSVADSMGTDLATIQSMDHSQLLRLLMQSSAK